MKQKEQQQVLQAYRDGEFNVLLATCIGEEGLDIPQVRTCFGFFRCQASVQCFQNRLGAGKAQK
jgi:Fanconi anemia group M protein